MENFPCFQDHLLFPTSGTGYVNENVRLVSTYLTCLYVFIADIYIAAKYPYILRSGFSEG